MKLYFTLLTFFFTTVILAQDCNLRIALPAELLLCEPGSITLSAIIDNGPDEVRWQPITGLLSPNASTTVAEVTDDITYTVEARRISDNELVTNGDFSQGDMGFTNDYINGTGGNRGLLTNAGEYAIASNARDTHSGFSRCRDRSGSGNIMVINSSERPNSNIWCQTVTIRPNTIYQFSAWATSVASDNPAQLQVRLNGDLLDDTYTMSANTCAWENFSAEWDSGSLTTAEICISNINFLGSGNDLALDDISFREICTASASVSIRIPELIADFSMANEICNDAPEIDLNTLLTPNSTLDGTWVLDGFPIIELLPNSLEVGPHLLEYLIQDGNCEVRPAQAFTIIAAPNAGSASDTDQACLVMDESINLGDLLTAADPGGIWEQSSGPSPASFDAAMGTAVLNEAGTYTFMYRVSGNAVCNRADTETVTIIRTALPVADLPTAAVLDCNSPEIDLSGPATTIGPDINYRWLRNGEPYPGETPNLTVDAEGQYTLVVTNANGCEASAQAEVINRIATISFETQNLQIPCDNPKGGGIVIDSISGGATPYLTSLNGSPFSMIENYADLAAGSYEVRVQDAGGCEGTREVQLFDPVVPTLMLTTGIEESLTLGESFTLRALTSLTLNNLDTLIWSPAVPDSLRTDIFQWRLTPLETTTYQLTAIDRNGCSAQAEVLVTIEPDGNVFVPNAISPNRDGNNDQLVIYDGGAIARIIELQIFNRWGSQVYQSDQLIPNNIANCWDGTRNGESLPADVYVYNLVVEWINGEVSQLSGEVHLVY